MHTSAIPAPLVSAEYTSDLEATLRNRARLSSNRNLLYWYKRLYEDQFRNLNDVASLNILEIGSGVSPLSRYYPSIRTSDVLQLDYLDYVFDCHEIDKFEPIADKSLDAITLTNVLHHLKAPIDFLEKAAGKLKPGGNIFATEPYFSVISSLVYRHLHHEPVDFSISRPELEEVRGPLSSANEALPCLIFERRDWRSRIERHYSLESEVFRPYTALSYFATGGISHRLPIPHFVFRGLFESDLWFSRIAPRLAASFFTVTLTRK